MALLAGEGPVAPNPVGATADLLQMLEKHSSIISGTQYGPLSWSTLWALPAPPGGNPVRLPVLMEVPDMTEEEIDVEEACDAGLVDREDLVDEKSKHSFLLYSLTALMRRLPATVTMLMYSSL